MTEAILWARDNIDVPIFAVAAYLVAVFYLPKHIGEGIKLRNLWSLWNLALSGFSILGASRTVPHLAAALRSEGWAYTVCQPPEQWYLRGETGFWVSMFIFSKIPELLDTVFLVLQASALQLHVALGTPHTRRRPAAPTLSSCPRSCHRRPLRLA